MAKMYIRIIISRKVHKSVVRLSIKPCTNLGPRFQHISLGITPQTQVRLYLVALLTWLYYSHKMNCWNI